jgi:transketolase
MSFPIPLSSYNRVAIDPWAQATLTTEQKNALRANIELCRDAIVFFTACGSASGYGGHTGGAFDTVPEVMLLDAFFRGRPDKFVPIFFDEAGHRVATQYLMSVLNGDMKAEQLVNYRKGHAGLPGHPELGCTPGVKFSSGRLGHMWPFVNGVAMANEGKTAICLGSDGSQQEGNDAEAARLAVAKNLNVKVIVDDNDVTIAGHPSDYFPGYSVAQTLRGHGLSVVSATGECLDSLYAAIRTAVTSDGPFAVVVDRKMAPGVSGVEGTSHGHDAFALKYALPFLESRGRTEAVAFLKAVKKTKDPWPEYKGSGKRVANRKEFGAAVSNELAKMDPVERVRKVMVIDCDLEGSTGLATIHKKHPEVYQLGGIMERGNISAAAGCGMEEGKQGVFSTFAAFLEMCVSELTMARLNNSNLLCHFSHSGSDDMADNTCHFGLNNFYADNGFEDQQVTRLYFPADHHQMHKCIGAVFHQPGLRFVFSTRSKLPTILDSKGADFFGEGYTFVPGKDDVVREGQDGWIVSFGDALYRSLDAVERLREQGLSVGLINKATLNVIDKATLDRVGRSSFVLVVEPLNTKTGLGIRFGTWLLTNGYSPRFGQLGAHHEGSGGLWEQVYHQGYDSQSIMNKVKQLAAPRSRL